MKERGLIFCLYLVFLTLKVPAAAEKFSTTDQRLSAITANYSEWLNKTGLSRPSNGWKLKVKRLIEAKCDGKSEDIKLFWILKDIDCRDPLLPVSHFVLSVSFEHPEKTWHNAPTGWEILNSKFRASKGGGQPKRAPTL